MEQKKHSLPELAIATTENRHFHKSSNCALFTICIPLTIQLFTY